MGALDDAVAQPAALQEDDIGESRWPPAIAVVVLMALNIAIRIWLPDESAVRVPFLVPAIEGALLLVLIAHPARHHPRRPWVRPVAVTLVLILVLAALWETTLLVSDLIRGRGVTNEPSQLLASGALVWLGNNLAFGLLYWLMTTRASARSISSSKRRPLPPRCLRTSSQSSACA